LDEEQKVKKGTSPAVAGEVPCLIIKEKLRF
jgi:hypothetical protein